MEFLSQLWLPILLSAVFVWIASAIMHMAVPLHKGEFEPLPDEAKVNEALSGVKPGQYMFPWATMSEMKDEAYLEKARKGPVGTLMIWPGMVNMGRNLGLTLLTYVVVSLFVAYIGWHSIGPETPYLTVFRIAGASAFLCYGIGWIPHMIWYGEKGFLANLIDGIVYSLVMGGTFGWLWPR